MLDLNICLDLSFILMCEIWYTQAKAEHNENKDLFTHYKGYKSYLQKKEGNFLITMSFKKLL